jgi:hypothetical protein
MFVRVCGALSTEAVAEKPYNSDTRVFFHK